MEPGGDPVEVDDRVPVVGPGIEVRPDRRDIFFQCTACSGRKVAKTDEAIQRGDHNDHESYPGQGGDERGDGEELRGQVEQQPHEVVQAELDETAQQQDRHEHGQHAAGPAPPESGGGRGHDREFDRHGGSDRRVPWGHAGQQGREQRRGEGRGRGHRRAHQEGQGHQRQVHRQQRRPERDEMEEERQYQGGGAEEPAEGQLAGFDIAVRHSAVLQKVKSSSAISCRPGIG